MDLIGDRFPCDWTRFSVATDLTAEAIDRSAQAYRSVLEETMNSWVERHLQQCAAEGRVDRRNGYYERGLLTTLGQGVVRMARTGTTSAVVVLNEVGFGRRTERVGTAILRCFLLGCSTRKVGGRFRGRVRSLRGH